MNIHFLGQYFIMLMWGPTVKIYGKTYLTIFKDSKLYICFTLNQMQLKYSITLFANIFRNQCRSQCAYCSIRYSLDCFFQWFFGFLENILWHRITKHKLKIYYAHFINRFSYYIMKYILKYILGSTVLLLKS